MNTGQLALFDDHGPGGDTCKPWRYRFTKNAMIEEGEDFKYIYGAWDKIFGCWEVDLKTGRKCEVIPSYPVLNCRGVWFAPERIRRGVLNREPITINPKWRFDSSAAFITFFSDIPPRIRQLVAPLGPYQWLAMDLIALDPDFAPFLENAIFNGQQQFLFACFSLSYATELSRKGRKDLIHAIMKMKRHELLGRLADKPCRKSTVRLLEKLGPDPLEVTDYKVLLDLAFEPNKAKALHHTQRLHPKALFAIIRLPEEMISANLLTLISRDQRCITIIEDFAWSAWHALSWKSFQRAVQSLKHVTTIRGLEIWSEKFSKEIAGPRELPAPPLPGNKYLLPLTTSNALDDESTYMSNCVEDLWEEVVEGDLYFYHWKGDVPATVSIRSDGAGGWKIGEILGIENEEIDDPTCWAIETILWEQHQPLFGYENWSPPPCCEETEEILNKFS